METSDCNSGSAEEFLRKKAKLGSKTIDFREWRNDGEAPVLREKSIADWIKSISQEGGSYSLIGATTEEQIDLSGIHCKPVIEFKDVTFRRRFVWRSADLSVLRMINCRLLGGFDTSGARLSGELDLQNSSVEGEVRITQVAADHIVLDACEIYCLPSEKRHMGIAASDLATENGFFLRNAAVYGGVVLIGARIGGNAEIIASIVLSENLFHQHKAISLDNAHVGGSLLVRSEKRGVASKSGGPPKLLRERCEVYGQISLNHTYVEKQVSFSGLRVSVDAVHSPAIAANQFVCKGKMIIGDETRVETGGKAGIRGGVRLDSASIRALKIENSLMLPARSYGYLHLLPASQHTSNKEWLETRDVMREASAYKRITDTKIEIDQLRTRRSKAAASGGSKSKPILSMRHFRCLEIFEWNISHVKIEGIIDMSWCHIGTLEIDWGVDGLGKGQNIGWVIDGLNYDNLNLQYSVSDSQAETSHTSIGRASIGRNSAARMLEWLERAKFDPFSYTKLARACYAHGIDDMGKKVYIAMERRRAESQRQVDFRTNSEAAIDLSLLVKQDNLSPESLRTRLLSTLDKLLGVFRGRNWEGRIARSYDHARYLIVGYGYAPERSIAWLLGSIVLGAIVFGVGFQNGLILNPASDSVLALDTLHSMMFGLVYSVDSALPFLDLQLESTWKIAEPTSGARGMMLWVYARVHTIVGWLLSTFFVAAVTGIIKKST